MSANAASRFKTYSAKPPQHEGGVAKDWILIDAESAVVGRLASFIAMRLRGKHRADYTPHVDCGDHVVVVNAGKVVFTGKKREEKVYHRHTGYPGGVKETTPARILEGDHPERVLKLAVQRMLPKESPLARQQLANLRIYAGPDHPHAAQQPKTVDFKARSSKNARIG
jgi:large subunit ribosomal protein L13